MHKLDAASRDDLRKIVAAQRRQAGPCSSD
jgi:hypothetical protein